MKFRIDFGRVFPGLILVISGLILLAILLIVAVIAFFFSFLGGSGGLLAGALELTLVPVLLVAAGVVTILSGVSWWGKGGEGWLSGIARRRALDDRMGIPARVGEVVGVVITTIIFFFLYENQLRGAAFFTSSFGRSAQFFFYAPLFTGMVLSLARAAHGRRNAIRPLDALNELFLAFAAYWLLTNWPFDFRQFGGLFPTQIQVLFGWLTNDIGRFLFILAVVGATISFLYTAVLYVSVRGELQRLRSDPTQ